MRRLGQWLRTKTKKSLGDEDSDQDAQSDGTGCFSPKSKSQKFPASSPTSSGLPTVICRLSPQKRAARDLRLSGMAVIRDGVSLGWLEASMEAAVATIKESPKPEKQHYDVTYRAASADPLPSEAVVAKLVDPIFDACAHGMKWLCWRHGVIFMRSKCRNQAWPACPPQATLSRLGEYWAFTAGISKQTISAPSCVHVFVPLVDWEAGIGSSRIQLPAGSILVMDDKKRPMGAIGKSAVLKPVLYWTYVRIMNDVSAASLDVEEDAEGVGDAVEIVDYGDMPPAAPLLVPKALRKILHRAGHGALFSSDSSPSSSGGRSRFHLDDGSRPGTASRPNTAGTVFPKPSPSNHSQIASDAPRAFEASSASCTSRANRPLSSGKDAPFQGTSHANRTLLSSKDSGGQMPSEHSAPQITVETPCSTMQPPLTSPHVPEQPGAGTLLRRQPLTSDEAKGGGLKSTSAADLEEGLGSIEDDFLQAAGLRSKAPGAPSKVKLSVKENASGAREPPVLRSSRVLKYGLGHREKNNKHAGHLVVGRNAL